MYIIFTSELSLHSFLEHILVLLFVHRHIYKEKYYVFIVYAVYYFEIFYHDNRELYFLLTSFQDRKQLVMEFSCNKKTKREKQQDRQQKSN